MAQGIPFHPEGRSGKRQGTLWPPGTRKRNRFWIWQGRIDGERTEFSTGTANKADAAEFARRAIRRLAEDRRSERERARSAALSRTFEEVAGLYQDARQCAEQDRRFIARLVAVAGDIDIAKIRQADMVPVIRRYYASAANATINRQVYTPFGAIIHWAAGQGWCEYRRVERLRVADTNRQAAPDDLGPLLLANTDGLQHAYCAILYVQGWRQSDAMRLSWEGVDLATLTFTTVIPKSGKLKSIPMDPIVRNALANLPGRREGLIFPWANRDAVRRWWKPLVESLGFPGVTPHQFRHAWGKYARAERATDDDMVEANTWTNRRSPQIYTRAPTPAARDLQSGISAKRQARTMQEQQAKNGGKKVG